MATKKSDVKRSVKVAEAIRGELMNMLLAGDVHDPGVQSAVISAVRLSDDLRMARVYARTLELSVDEGDRQRLLDALNRARGYLRREVAQRLRLRYAPELRFFWDDSIDEGRQIEALLREVRGDADDGSGDA